jgi:methionyl-tRNA formyltransferase
VKVIFAGTPGFAATHLQSILNDDCYQLVGVYTQPDRPAGRGKKITQSPVKSLAIEHNIPVFQPSSLKEPEPQRELAELNADIMVVVAYGLILPQAVLNTPRLGCVNVHGSLLPKWRGAAPIQRAIEAGDVSTGVTVMQMDAGLDTGAMLTISRCDIDSDETSLSLYEKLAVLGSESLMSTLAKLKAGTAIGIAQDDSLSSYAHKITKSEAQIDWAGSATDIDRLIRAFNPAPAAYSLLEGQRLKVWSAIAVTSHQKAAPGEILCADAKGILVKCGEDAILLNELQLAGKSRLPVSEILKARAASFACGKILGV